MTIPSIDLTDEHFSLRHKGKYIEASTGGGSCTNEVRGNYLIDINIIINLNVGDQINPDTLKQVDGLLDKILKVKKWRTYEMNWQEKVFNSSGQYTKKCTICHSVHNDGGLIRMPEEFQVYARRKRLESWFCPTCCQVVNFYLWN
jgi:hypothetical protein